MSKERDLDKAKILLAHGLVCARRTIAYLYTKYKEKQVAEKLAAAGRRLIALAGYVLSLIGAYGLLAYDFLRKQSFTKKLKEFVMAGVAKLVAKREPAVEADTRETVAAEGPRNKHVWLKLIAVNLLILMVTGPFIALYGPFTNIKRTVVGAIMTSRHPQYITWLLSEKEIKGIIGDPNSATELKQQLFQFTKRSDDTLRLVNIESTRFHGLLLEVPDPTRVKAVTARDIREKGDTVSTIALANNAVAGINAGGFYDPQGTGTGRLPYGVIIHEGKFLVGGDINETVQVVGLTKNGVLVAGNYNPKELRSMNVAEAVTFGPPLIINGKKLITQGDGGWGIAPRTAIGQRKDGTILLLVIDGRQPGYSLGATLLDVQNILYEQGAYVAANLDGGSSTTLFYDGKVMNKPCDMLGERMVPTAFIVK